VPIDAPEEVRRFTVPAFYQWHFADAFERGDQLVVDYVRYPDFSSNLGLGEVMTGPAHGTLGGTLHRAVIDPARGRMHEQQLAPVACEFPRVARPGSGSRFVYVASYSDEEAARGMLDQVARIDVERGTVEAVSLGAGHYPSEPVFVRRPGALDSDDGWLLTLVYDGVNDRSGVAVLDAREPSREPLARAWLDHAVPFTFHGNFAPA